MLNQRNDELAHPTKETAHLFVPAFDFDENSQNQKPASFRRATYQGTVIGA